MNKTSVEDIEKMLLALYQGKKVAILGYGEDGRKRADFLRERGIEVIIGLRDQDKHLWEQAKGDGYEVYPFYQAAQMAAIAQVW